MNKSILDLRYKNAMEDIIYNEYPLSFKKDFNFYNNESGLNCYAYALGLTKTISTSDMFFQPHFPGFLSLVDNDNITKYNLLIKVLTDLSILGFDICDSSYNDKSYEDRFRLGILYEEGSSDKMIKDFHFVRENIEGFFSDRQGYYIDDYKMNVNRIDNPNNIKYYQTIKVLSLKR